MSVYVGKDVTITVQVPVEEDVSSQANGSQAVFTVTNKPISDRDLDGVADEIEHVTVYVNGSEVNVSAVDDSEGQVTLASAPAQGSRVIIECRYDTTPNIAQEITLEPRQVTEGIDGLGSDVIQQWAVLLKEISGKIKETYKMGSKLHLERVTKNKYASLYSQQFWVAGALDDFQGDTGNFSVDNEELLVANNNGSTIGVKNSVLTVFRNGIVKCKMKYYTGSGDAGWIFRWDGTTQNYYRAYVSGLKKLKIDRVKDGNSTNLLESDVLTLPGTMFPVEVKFVEEKIIVDVNGNVFTVIDSNPLLISGMPGFYAYFGQNHRFDNFEIWKETSPHEYGMIVKWDQGGSIVRVGLDKVVFLEGSVPSPKNRPTFIVTPFKAQTVKTIN